MRDYEILVSVKLGQMLFWCFIFVSIGTVLRHVVATYFSIKRMQTTVRMNENQDDI